MQRGPTARHPAKSALRAEKKQNFSLFFRRRRNFSSLSGREISLVNRDLSIKWDFDFKSDRLLERIVLRPRRGCFPNLDRHEPDFPVEGVALIQPRRVIDESFGERLKDHSRHDLCGRVLIFERDNPVSIARTQFRVGRVGGIDAYRMIQNFKIIADEFLHDQKVAHHFVSIEMFSLKDELHFARMTMRKFALAGMLRQHVATFDIDGLANAIRHFRQQTDLPPRGKCKLAFQ